MAKTVIAVPMDDSQKILGVGRVDQLPAFGPSETVHSTDPRLPLTDRTSRFYAVDGPHELRSRPDCAVIELRETNFVDRANLPKLYHRGHEIHLRREFGSGHNYDRIQLPAYVEVEIDGKHVVGAVDGSENSIVKVAAEAIRLADLYIDEQVEAKRSAF